MIPPVPPRFGVLLRRLRKEAGLTQATLAERAHMSGRGLQDLERGLHKAPRRDTLDLLAAALGLAGQDRAAFLAAASAAPAAGCPAAPREPAASPMPWRRWWGGSASWRCWTASWPARVRPAAAARVLLLAGEPGIGKTRLLQAAAQQAVARGWCVLVGGCQRRGGEDPYAPLLAALARHLGLLTAGAARRRTARAAPGWCGCCPSWPRCWSRSPPPPSPPSRSGG